MSVLTQQMELEIWIDHGQFYIYDEKAPGADAAGGAGERALENAEMSGRQVGVAGIDLDAPSGDLVFQESGAGLQPDGRQRASRSVSGAGGRSGLRLQRASWRGTGFLPMPDVATH